MMLPSMRGAGVYACRCKRLPDDRLWVGLLFIDRQQVRPGQQVQLKERPDSCPIEVIIPKFGNERQLSQITLEIAK